MYKTKQTKKTYSPALALSLTSCLIEGKRRSQRVGVRTGIWRVE